MTVRIVRYPFTVIEQYIQPRNGKYLVKQLIERGDIITAQFIPALQLDADRIFE